MRHQPNFDDGVDEPTGKGTEPRRRPDSSYRAERSPAAPRRPRSLKLAARRPALGVTADRGARPRRPARRPDGPRSGGGRCDEAPRQADRRRPRSSCSSSCVVTTLATGVLVVTIGNLTFASTHEYKAVFTDATGVVKGDDIRIAGVKVGTVKDVEIVDRDPGAGDLQRQDDTTPSTRRTHATIRYRNLVGQRYISLTQEIGDSGAAAAEGATIPVVADLAGARPDGAVQRLQAAVPGAVAGGHQQAVLRDRPGLPGRGRHPREPARAHRVGDQHARPTATR